MALPKKNITKHGSALGIAKFLPIIDVLGYDGQNISFSFSSSSPPPCSDSTPITQEGSHISSTYMYNIYSETSLE